MENVQLQIMAVGREAAILQVVERLINSHKDWVATAVATEADAIAAFRIKRHPIVLVCAGFSLEEEQQLRSKLLEIEPSVVVIRHYGGGSGLLENEILGILQSK